MNERNEQFEWIGVSELARRKNVSTQLIYLQIKEGLYETTEFARGSMKGYLIKVPKDESKD